MLESSSPCRYTVLSYKWKAALNKINVNNTTHTQGHIDLLVIHQKPTCLVDDIFSIRPLIISNQHAEIVHNKEAWKHVTE